MKCQQPLETSVLTVSQLNRAVRQWLEHEMGAVSVEGEISNISKPSSGHYYFTLKDPQAQLRCVYFRNRHKLLVQSTLQNGQQIIAHGQLSLYEARGDYQLIVDRIEEAGEGNLYQQFERLKAKLMALGLFESSRKKALPRFPRCIGLITSASGAAVQDMLTTLARRFPIAHVVIYNSEVQGKQAAQQLMLALHHANRESRCDVLILARGGGSMEDLWAFNDEQLAYAIVNSSIPIVSGIGHETDFTIADFVSDLRAATPTAAAEAVTPNQCDLIAYFQSVITQLQTTLQRAMQYRRLQLSHAMQTLVSPKDLIRHYWQSLDYCCGHLQHAIQQNLAQKHLAAHRLTTQLSARNPILILRKTKLQLQALEQALLSAMHRLLNFYKQTLATQTATLHAISPQATLERGYAIATHRNHILLSSASVACDAEVEIRLAKGALTTKVLSTTTE